ncbi:SAM-dependent methyltransferase [Pseudonocardia adelaidensis]|uniref:SAM-dependent methyltransferase n=1 Tax=Pseudonocardia adelaidensis TaxID=648754 RepID=A0ABP9NDD6_9PSEU
MDVPSGRDLEVDLQTGRAHGARIYDYVLGGKDNYARDRAAAEAAMSTFPTLQISMRSNRAFMHRVGRFLAAERGIRQFLDIGTGIPTSPNLHEVVQAVAPSARIVYTDNDPIVLAHARALMKSTPEGRTTYVQSDLREPDAILAAPQLTATLDLTEPVGLLAIAVVHFIDDEDEAHRVVRRLLDAVPSGSYFAMSTATGDFDPAGTATVERAYRERGEVLKHRTKAQVERFFDGWELLEPGVVQVHKWRPDDFATALVKNDSDVALLGGVARKP